MAVAFVLIFACNTAIIHCILKLNDAHPGGRLTMGASIIAVATCPYITLRGNATSAWFVPLAVALIGVAGRYLVNLLLASRESATPCRT